MLTILNFPFDDPNGLQTWKASWKRIIREPLIKKIRRLYNIAISDIKETIFAVAWTTAWTVISNFFVTQQCFNCLQNGNVVIKIRFFIFISRKWYFNRFNEIKVFFIIIFYIISTSKVTMNIIVSNIYAFGNMFKIFFFSSGQKSVFSTEFEDNFRLQVFWLRG